MGFHSLSIGTSALLTAQYGLNVTGQNLGNVDTPGYSRQVLRQRATIGNSSIVNNAVLGNGVTTQSIRRIGSEFMERQLRQSYSTDEYYRNMEYTYANISAAFNELTGNALSDSMQRFWDAMGDFSTKVEQLPIRTTTLNQAEQLTRRFNQIGNHLAQHRIDIDNEIEASIGEINRLLEGIATMNVQVVSGEMGGVTGRTANDLRDQRGELVKELYGYMDVDVVEEPNGSYIVSFHGRTLVYLDQVKPLENIKTVSEDGTTVNTPAFAEDKYPVRPKDGTLAAQMNTRDVVIPSYQKEINALAGNFIWEFNRIHSQSKGLESYTSLTSLNGPTNPEATLDKLNYGKTLPEGVFEIKNGNFEIVVHNKVTNQPTTINIEVDVDNRLNPAGEPDMILFDPNNPDASHSLINRMQKELDEKVPGVFEVSIDRNNRVTIKSKSEEYDFSFGKDTSGVLAALGLNVFFTGHDAMSMGVNQELLENPSLVAGASKFEKGNNDAAVALLALQDKQIGNLRGGTFDDYYRSVAGRLGSESAKTENMKLLSCDIYNRMFSQRESLAGVNEDEEVSKLITYQRSFQSAAKYISTVDQLYETLINM